MRYPTLITTDIHLTDHPSTEYRWSLFPWINDQIERKGVKSVRILGDITDAKDNHSAALVNRVVSAIKSIECDDIAILAGNHDWLKRGEEFFRFLNHLPNVRFITEPSEDPDLKGPPVMYLPYSKNPAADWKGWDFSHYEFLFMHQTVKGAMASNGQEMEGEPLPPLNAARVYSGDIHVPQTINGVTYIGSPYHVHFGDNFTPRVLLLDRGGRENWLHMPSPKRVVVKASSLRELKRFELVAGDQVKLRMTLGDEEKHAWSKIKREAVAILEDRGVIVHGVELLVAKSNRRIMVGESPERAALSPEELILRFVEHEELGGSALDAALEVIES